MLETVNTWKTPRLRLGLGFAVAMSVWGCREAAERPAGVNKTSLDELTDREGILGPASGDPLVNPLLLAWPPPRNRDWIATDEWLFVCLRGNPGSLNPILSSSTSEERIKSVLYDYPFVYDDKLAWSVNETMVESYEESADHLISTLRLKKGLKWHDGHRYTAHDIAFSWRQIVDQRVPARGVRGGKDQIAECVALDDWTVRFVHKKALPTNKWNVMFGAIPKHLYGPGKAEDPTLATSELYNRLNRSPIGNGPYRFVEWVPDDKIVFERWEQYPGPKPYFARIVFRIIPDAHSRLLAFERQEVDEVSLTPQQFALETAGERFAAVGVKGYAPRWSFYYIGWNQDGSNPFFSDRRVRRAMCHAMNYDLIIKQVCFGLFEQSYGTFHPSSPMFNASIERFDYDLARAAVLLDEAGWYEDETDGWRYKDVAGQGGAVRRVRHADQTKFSFTLNIPGGETAPKTAAIVQEDLKRIGVEMKVRSLEWATFLEKLGNHEFEAFFSAFTAGVDPDQAWNIWHSRSYDGGRNYGGFANARVDELFELGRKTMDHAKRMRYYAELSKIIYDDAAATFLVDAPNLWAFNKRLRGVTFSPRGPFMFDPGMRRWWVPQGSALHAGAGR
ncbi:MAG: ABC transporter substrate-binding protein [Phycisphaerae bacterium]